LEILGTLKNLPKKTQLTNKSIPKKGEDLTNAKNPWGPWGSIPDPFGGIDPWIAKFPGIFPRGKSLFFVGGRGGGILGVLWGR